MTTTTHQAAKLAALLLISACGAPEPHGLSQEEVAAANLPSIGISRPQMGDELRLTSTWYDAATEEIIVQGGFRVAPGTPVGSVMINGTVVASITPMPGGRASFQGRLLMPSDLDTVYRGVLVELLDNAVPPKVLARDVVSYFDFRIADAATSHFDVDDPIRGMAAQVTTLGVGDYVDAEDERLEALEVPVKALLPDPGMTVFNQELTAAAAAIVPSTLDDQELCIDLDDPALAGSPVTDPLQFTALAAAMALAQAEYVAYRTYQEVAGDCTLILTPIVGPLALLCQAGEVGWCVREAPELKDFELCVGKVEAEPTALTASALEEIQLAFETTASGANGGLIQSHVNLRDIHGTVEGRLRDLKVRWRKDLCIPGPEASESEAMLSVNKAVQDWATCPDLEVNAERADTTLTARPERFRIQEGNQAAPETLIVQQIADASFGLVEVDLDAKHGACGLGFVLPTVETLLGTFVVPFQGKIGATWNAGGTLTDQAVALELVLDRYELGLLTFEDLTLDAQFEPFRSHREDGLEILLQTAVQPIDPDTNDLRNPGRLHLEPSLEWEPAADGVDPNTNRAFDISYAVTTGYLNQIVNLRAATHLHFDFTPTKTDLYEAGFANSGGDQLVTLDGTTLGRVHRMFEQLGTMAVTIEVKPLLDPVIWMSPDPYDLKTYGAPLTYELPQLEVRFVDAGGLEWLLTRVSVVDEDFTFSLDKNGGDYLTARFSGDEWVGVTILKNNFANVVEDPHGIFEPPTSRERDVEAALAALLGPTLREKLLHMVAQVPAPQRFGDSVTRETWPHLLDGAGRWQADQYVTLFADVDNVPTRP